MVIRWENPPPRGEWRKTARELAERPGEWACVLENVPVMYAEQAAARSLRRNGCEATVRKLDMDRASVWARWPEDA